MIKRLVNLHPSLMMDHSKRSEIFDLKDQLTCRELHEDIAKANFDMRHDEDRDLDMLKHIRLIKSALLIAGYDPYTDRGLARIKASETRIDHDHEKQTKTYFIKGVEYLKEEYSVKTEGPTEGKDGSISMKVTMYSKYSINGKDHK